MAGETDRQGSGTNLIPGAAPVVDAVQRVFRDGLLRGASSFVPGLVVWNRETASDLRVRFVEQPDTSSDTFLVKLRRQLDGAPDGTIVLAAELTSTSYRSGVSRSEFRGSGRSSPRSFPGLSAGSTCPTTSTRR